MSWKRKIRTRSWFTLRCPIYAKPERLAHTVVGVLCLSSAGSRMVPRWGHCRKQTQAAVGMRRHRDLTETIVFPGLRLNDLGRLFRCRSFASRSVLVEIVLEHNCKNRSVGEGDWAAHTTECVMAVESLRVPCDAPRSRETAAEVRKVCSGALRCSWVEPVYSDFGEAGMTAK